MLAFGEQLYRMTVRDEETLKLEPFLRRVDTSIASGAGNVTAAFQLPSDRALYLHSYVVQFAGEALTQYTQWRTNFEDAVSSLSHQIDGSFPLGLGLGIGFVQKRDIGFVLPPFTRQLTVQVFRSGTPASVAPVSVWVTGYLIPPGRIARA